MGLNQVYCGPQGVLYQPRLEVPSLDKYMNCSEDVRSRPNKFFGGAGSCFFFALLRGILKLGQVDEFAHSFEVYVIVSTLRGGQQVNFEVLPGVPSVEVPEYCPCSSLSAFLAPGTQCVFELSHGYDARMQSSELFFEFLKMNRTILRFHLLHKLPDFLLIPWTEERLYVILGQVIVGIPHRVGADSSFRLLFVALEGFFSFFSVIANTFDWRWCGCWWYLLLTWGLSFKKSRSFEPLMLILEVFLHRVN